MYDVYFIDSSEFDIWDDYVNQHPNATPYHLTSWNISIHNAYKHDVHYLIAKNSNKVSGILPMCHIKRPLVSDVVCASPYCDLGGVLHDNRDVRTALINKAIEFSHELGEVKLVLRERNIEHTAAHDVSGLANKKVSMILSLPETSNVLFSSFKSKLRSQIKKAEKNGLIFKFGNQDHHLSAFYTIFTHNMKQLGSPTHSYEWFKQIRNNYTDNFSIGLIYYNDLAVGTGILIRQNNSCFIPWASTITAYNRLAPNMLLYWNMLKLACDYQCDLFDFGRSTYGEGTYKFKKQWGAEPVPLIWSQYDTQGRKTIENLKHGSLRKLSERVWRVLPLFAVNRIGPHIRKYISL